MKKILASLMGVCFLAGVPVVNAVNLQVDEVTGAFDETLQISVRLLNDSAIGTTNQAFQVGFRMIYDSDSLELDVDSTFFPIIDLLYEAGEVKFIGERDQDDPVGNGSIVITFNVALKEGVELGEYVLILAPLDAVHPQVWGFGDPVPALININLDPPFGLLVDGSVTFTEPEPDPPAGGSGGGGSGGCFISTTFKF